jgi:hypothetical protein
MMARFWSLGMDFALPSVAPSLGATFGTALWAGKTALSLGPDGVAVMGDGTSHTAGDRVVVAVVVVVEVTGSVEFAKDSKVAFRCVVVVVDVTIGGTSEGVVATEIHIVAVGT